MEAIIKITRRWDHPHANLYNIGDECRATIKPCIDNFSSQYAILEDEFNVPEDSFEIVKLFISKEILERPSADDKMHTENKLIVARVASMSSILNISNPQTSPLISVLQARQLAIDCFFSSPVKEEKNNYMKLFENCNDVIKNYLGL